MSAKERMILYSSDQDVPHFASENPSVKSHFSDHVDSHPLTEIDDYDIDDNLSSIVLSIKKQNDNLMSRIQSKRKQKIDLASTMNTNAKSRVLGVPLRDFQTPEVSKFRTKVIESDFISPDERRIFGHDDENNHYEEHAKSSHVDTEEVELEREDASEADQKLNISGTHKKSELSSAYDALPEDKGVTSEECTLLKSWVTRMAQKLRQAEREIQMLQLQRKEDLLHYQTKLEESNKYIHKLKSSNRSLNKKLIQAIEAIKMSCFSYELNQDRPENTIRQLEIENRNLRICLKIQSKFDCRDEVEEILRSEELVVRNKESFLRSRSYQFNNKAAFSFVKNEEAVFDRKGKRSQGKPKLT